MIPGPMAIARFGTCGISEASIPAGSILIPSESLYIQQNFDYDQATDHDESKAFYITKPCPGNAALNGLLAAKFAAAVGPERVHVGGLDSTCETFYSGQGTTWSNLRIGRKLVNFSDPSVHIIDNLKKQYPKHFMIQMETYCM